MAAVAGVGEGFELVRATEAAKIAREQGVPLDGVRYLLATLRRSGVRCSNTELRAAWVGRFGASYERRERTTRRELHVDSSSSDEGVEPRAGERGSSEFSEEGDGPSGIVSEGRATDGRGDGGKMDSGDDDVRDAGDHSHRHQSQRRRRRCLFLCDNIAPLWQYLRDARPPDRPHAYYEDNAEVPFRHRFDSDVTALMYVVRHAYSPARAAFLSARAYRQAAARSAGAEASTLQRKAKLFARCTAALLQLLPLEMNEAAHEFRRLALRSKGGGLLDMALAECDVEFLEGDVPAAFMAAELEPWRVSGEEPPEDHDTQLGSPPQRTRHIVRRSAVVSASPAGLRATWKLSASELMESKSAQQIGIAFGEILWLGLLWTTAILVSSQPAREDIAAVGIEVLAFFVVGSNLRSSADWRAWRRACHLLAVPPKPALVMPRLVRSCGLLDVATASVVRDSDEASEHQSDPFVPQEGDAEYGMEVWHGPKGTAWERADKAEAEVAHAALRRARPADWFVPASHGLPARLCMGAVLRDATAVVVFLVRFQILARVTYGALRALTEFGVLNATGETELVVEVCIQIATVTSRMVLVALPFLSLQPIVTGLRAATWGRAALQGVDHAMSVVVPFVAAAVVLLCGFAAIFTILFGSEAGEAYGSFYVSFQTLLRAVFGDIDFDAHFAAVDGGDGGLHDMAAPYAGTALAWFGNAMLATLVLSIWLLGIQAVVVGVTLAPSVREKRDERNTMVAESNVNQRETERGSKILAGNESVDQTIGSVRNVASFWRHYEDIFAKRQEAPAPKFPAPPLPPVCNSLERLVRCCCWIRCCRRCCIRDRDVIGTVRLRLGACNIRTAAALLLIVWSVVCCPLRWNLCCGDTRDRHRRVPGTGVGAATVLLPATRRSRRVASIDMSIARRSSKDEQTHRDAEGKHVAPSPHGVLGEGATVPSNPEPADASDSVRSMYSTEGSRSSAERSPSPPAEVAGAYAKAMGRRPTRYSLVNDLSHSHSRTRELGWLPNLRAPRSGAGAVRYVVREAAEQLPNYAELLRGHALATVSSQLIAPDAIQRAIGSLTDLEDTTHTAVLKVRDTLYDLSVYAQELATRAEQTAAMDRIGAMRSETAEGITAQNAAINQIYNTIYGMKGQHMEGVDEILETLRKSGRETAAEVEEVGRHAQATFHAMAKIKELMSVVRHENELEAGRGEQEVQRTVWWPSHQFGRVSRKSFKINRLGKKGSSITLSADGSTISDYRGKNRKGRGKRRPHSAILRRRTSETELRAVPSGARSSGRMYVTSSGPRRPMSATASRSRQRLSGADSSSQDWPDGHTGGGDTLSDASPFGVGSFGSPTEAGNVSVDAAAAVALLAAGEDKELEAPHHSMTRIIADAATSAEVKKEAEHLEGSGVISHQAASKQATPLGDLLIRHMKKSSTGSPSGAGDQWADTADDGVGAEVMDDSDGSSSGADTAGPLRDLRRPVESQEHWGQRRHGTAERNIRIHGGRSSSPQRLHARPMSADPRVRQDHRTIDSPASGVRISAAAALPSVPRVEAALIVPPAAETRLPLPASPPRRSEEDRLLPSRSATATGRQRPKSAGPTR